VEPSAIADAFVKHFKSVYNNNCRVDIFFLSLYSEFSSLAPISDADICKAIERLKLSKFLGLNDILVFFYLLIFFIYLVCETIGTAATPRVPASGDSEDDCDEADGM
jgi:hypothetical protein